MIDRRTLLANAALLASATALAPSIAYAQADTPKRFLFVLQRGAADGMATLAPLGDSGFSQLRGQWVDSFAEAPKIDSFFALHPALERIAGFHADGQASFLHAVASAYRERSHFDGQNLLESGGPQAYSQRDGWINRLVGMLPEGRRRALALAPAIPLAMQGNAPVTSYAPSSLPEATAELSQRVSMLYESDPELSALWEEALRTRAMAGDNDMRNLRNAQETGGLAASLMTGSDSARIMMVESNGWDSHANQPGQLNNAFRRLDTFLGAFSDGMGSDWSNTLVIVATEFGRTARINGTNGTDHGTASAAMLLGGAVRDVGVRSDWPGLASSALLQDRDLRPTASLEAGIAGAVAGHFSLDPTRAMPVLFPGRDARAMEGLVRA